MRLLNSFTLEFHEFEFGSCPPYAILSHTWGGEEILYRDMLWIQDYHRTYESDDQSSRGKDKANEAEAEGDPDGASGSGPAPRTLPDEDEACPEYEEVEQTSTEDQSTARALRSRHGYSKILKIAEHCRVSQIGYFWIDTCCIDKSNGSEVSEAILSAYRWYKAALVCFVYLADVPPTDALADRDSVFRRSWWFTRGWTLIELLAPTARVWFDQEWNFIFPESPLISDITGINTGYLEGADLNLACIAKRMSWAAGRNTTRPEDVAYCLMGLFDVSMSVRYGEGPEKAFLRLQKKILKAFVDPSIFAWGYNAPILGDSTGLLATSPDDFSGCGTLRRDLTVLVMNDYFFMGPRGMEFRTDIGHMRSNRDGKMWEGEYSLLMSEVRDDASPNDRILMPLGTIDRGPPDGLRTILRRFPGTRPVLVTPKARGRLSLLPRREIFLRSERAANPVLNVLFTPSHSTLPFKLVEVFPHHAFMPSLGGVVSPNFRTIPPGAPPAIVFFRYEEDVTGPSRPFRRRFVVALSYTGKRERSGAPFEISGSKVCVVNVTNSNLLSFCDTFLMHPDKAKPANWTRFLSNVPVGDTLVSASVEVDSERWDLMRLHVRTAPLGSVADGVVSGDMLAAMAGARSEGERLRSPFD